MRQRSALFVALTLLAIVPIALPAQSTMEFQPGTHIEVTDGADICADNVLFNENYSGSGTLCGGVLPIELASMGAEAAEQTVTLTWTTATEVDNLGFEVERRCILESQSVWEHVGFVGGAGTTASPRSYSCVDANLSPGRYAYRLRQIDRDGTARVYAEVEVVIEGPDEFALASNFPNPFNPTTTIRYDIPRRSSVVLTVYNSLGQEVAELVNAVKETGFYRVDFDASGLRSGVYMFRLRADALVQTRKMVLLR